jgi:Fic family protein
MNMTTNKERALDAAYRPFPTIAHWLERTSVTDSRWDRYLRELNSYPKERPAALKKARQIAQRVAAFDTGAIEGLYETDRGFTYSVAFEIGAWQAELEAKGHNVRSLFEAQLTAYESLVDLATKAEQLSEAAIRELHQQLVAAQETYLVQTAVGPQEHVLPKGRYKTYSNHVKTRDGDHHSYAPVDLTPEEMSRLVQELQSEVFLAAHAAQQISYVHYALVCIHPFADGNGRVARALASVYSLRALSLPTVILSEQKEQYLNALERADAGDFQAFVEFMTNAVLDTIRLVVEDLKRPGDPQAEDTAQQIKSLYLTKSGFTEVEIDLAGEKLREVLLHALGEKAAMVRSGELIVMINRTGAPASDASSSNQHRRTFNSTDTIYVSIQSKPPKQQITQKWFEILVPKNAATDSDILFVSDNLQFEARPNELVPVISGMLRLRASVFAETVFETMLQQLLTHIETSAT